MRAPSLRIKFSLDCTHSRGLQDDVRQNGANNVAKLKEVPTDVEAVVAYEPGI
jgi:hypothetical protein